MCVCSVASRQNGSDMTGGDEYYDARLNGTPDLNVECTASERIQTKSTRFFVWSCIYLGKRFYARIPSATL